MSAVKRTRIAKRAEVTKQKRWISQAEIDAQWRLGMLLDFVGRQDPERLAYLALDDVETSLRAAEAFDRWLHEYADALKLRRSR